MRVSGPVDGDESEFVGVAVEWGTALRMARFFVWASWVYAVLAVVGVVLLIRSTPETLFGWLLAVGMIGFFVLGALGCRLLVSLVSASVNEGG